MGREIEIKIPLTENEYKTLLEVMRGQKTVKGLFLVDKITPLIIKKDEYYSRFSDESSRRKAGEPRVIRLRTNSDGRTLKSYLTVKNKSLENGIEVNREYETFVEGPNVVRKLFESTGFICWFCKEKKAFGIHAGLCAKPDLVFHLEAEEVNQLKYIEVEVTDEKGGADEIKSALETFVRSLGLNSQKKDSRSWVEIITQEKLD